MIKCINEWKYIVLFLFCSGELLWRGKVAQERQMLLWGGKCCSGKLLGRVEIARGWQMLLWEATRESGNCSGELLWGVARGKSYSEDLLWGVARGS